MSLPEESLETLLKSCEGLPVDAFAPGDVLLPEGPSLNRMFILRDGDVEVVRGDTQISEIGEPGAIFGELAALLGIGHTATVKAVTPVNAFRIDDADKFLREHTELSYQVACVLAQRLVDATAYLVDVKRQFAGHKDHFGLVDEVLEALSQRQRKTVSAGPSTDWDPRL